MDRIADSHTVARRVVVTIAVLVGVGLACPSQAEAQLGVRGGVSLTDFFGGDVHRSKAVRNMSYGLSLGLIRLGPLQVVAEGYYRRKGAGWSILDALGSGGAPMALDSAELAGLLSDPASGLANETLEFGLDYVEIPVLLRINLPLIGSRVRPYLNGGPAFGWRLDCGVTLQLGEASGENATETACDDLTGDQLEQTLRDYETGVVLGGGLAMSVFGGMGALSLDARLTRGLSRLSEGDTGPEVRNHAFSVLLGYSFGFF